TLRASSITDSSNRQLDGNGDAISGDNYVLSFFKLSGDANHDRAVNFTDLVWLAQNYGGSGKTWVQADFNGDGNVDFNDLVLLAQNYNKTLAAPGAPAVPAPTVTTSPEQLAAAIGLPIQRQTPAPPPTRPKPVVVAKPAKPQKTLFSNKRVSPVLA